MSLTKFSGAINTIQSLSDQPNQSDGLTAAQLKMKFDQHAIDSKTYLNDILTSEIESQFATKTEVQGVVLNQIPDGTVTIPKLAFDPATQIELDDINRKIRMEVL